MTLYTYKAYDPSGLIVQGEIEADSDDNALERLAAQDYIPEWVKEKRASSGGAAGFLAGVSVKAGDLILYTKQFRTLLAAGVGILQIFQVMEAQTENKTLNTAIAAMAEEIRKGASLHKAFLNHPKVFSRLYTAMIRAGEESGALPQVLDRLIYIIEHEDKVRNDIKAAVRYPIIVLMFLAVAFVILLTFVVPKFARIFEHAGIALPLPTRICMAMHHFVSHYWLMILLGIILTVTGITLYVRSENGRFVRDKIMLAVPIIGPVVLKSAMSRFSSIFSILQSSGITVLESMRILCDTINNTAVTREIDNIRSLMEEGQGIAGPLAQARYFTPMVINMVAIGEESGNLDDMLQEISSHYDAEVEYATKGMSDALGPILMVGIAAVVGFFALAIFLPMWDLTKMV